MQPSLVKDSCPLIKKVKSTQLAQSGDNYGSITHCSDVIDPLREISKAVRIGDVIHNNHTLQKEEEVHTS